MRKLFLILSYCAMVAIFAHQTMAGDGIAAESMSEYTIMAGNQTDGHIGIYFTGDDAGIRGYVQPQSGNSFGPIPAGTYDVLITTNASGTYTFTVNGQSVTTDKGYANFTVDVTNNVYILIK
jgi:streptogramin lyase